MKNEAQVGGTTVCGQPTDAELRDLPKQGYTAVINFRMPEELDEPEAPKMPPGITYYGIPFTGATLSREHVEQTRAALKSSEGKVLVH